jgi:hypothetical protein
MENLSSRSTNIWWYPDRVSSIRNNTDRNDDV